ncbi:hypothetical protein ACRAWF_05720 [Streptomyces sp. L7]
MRVGDPVTGRTVHLDGKPVTLAELPLKRRRPGGRLPRRGRRHDRRQALPRPPGPGSGAPSGPHADHVTPRGPPHRRQPAPRTRLAHRHRPRPRRRLLGYAMRRRSANPNTSSWSACSPRAQRLRLFPDRADWRFLLGVSWNLAFMTARTCTATASSSATSRRATSSSTPTASSRSSTATPSPSPTWSPKSTSRA